MAISTIKDTSKISLTGSTDNTLTTVTGADAIQGEANLTFNGSTLNVVGNAGVGIARTEGTLHVHTATAGSISAIVHANDLVVENSANAGISILSPSGNTGRIVFGDENANAQGAIIYAHAADSLAFQTGATERIQITSAGYLRMAGAGIQFNGDTAAANALDDYEEGTYTAAFTAGSGTITIRENVGVYTKIGRSVHVQGYHEVSAISSPSGAWQITGLPFTSSNSNLYGPRSAVAASATGFSSSIGSLVPLINENEAVISLKGFNGTVFADIAGSVQVNVTLWYSLTYTV